MRMKPAFAGEGVADERRSSLPPSLAPRGLSRVQAAEYIGVGVTKFDELVTDGRMPKPKRIDEYLIWDRFQLDKLPTIGTIYILGFDHYVKIGFTRNLKKRIFDIQSGVPRKLHVYTSFEGTFKDEKDLHKRFNTYRQSGEWFILGPKLCNFILEKLNLPGGKKHLRDFLIERGRLAESRRNPWDDL